MGFLLQIDASVNIQRHALRALHFTVNLYYSSENGELYRTFSSYDEMEKTLKELGIQAEQLQVAHQKFVDGAESVSLGSHMFQFKSLTEHGFRKKLDR